MASEKKRFTTGVTLWQGLTAQLANGSATHVSDVTNAAAWVQSMESNRAARGASPGVSPSHVTLTVPSADAAKPIVLVVTGEKPYAEGGGDTRNPHLDFDDEALIHSLHHVGARVILVLYSGRPLLISNHILEQLDGFVAAWLPGTEAGDGLADVLLGKVGFSGLSSFGWPKSTEQLGRQPPDSELLFPRGAGIKTAAHPAAPAEVM